MDSTTQHAGTSRPTAIDHDSPGAPQQPSLFPIQDLSGTSDSTASSDDVEALESVFSAAVVDLKDASVTKHSSRGISALSSEPKRASVHGETAVISLAKQSGTPVSSPDIEYERPGTPEWNCEKKVYQSSDSFVVNVANEDNSGAESGSFNAEFPTEREVCPIDEELARIEKLDTAYSRRVASYLIKRQPKGYISRKHVLEAAAGAFLSDDQEVAANETSGFVISETAEDNTMVDGADEEASPSTASQTLLSASGIQTAAQMTHHGSAVAQASAVYYSAPAEAVLGCYELLENILLQASFATVLRCQGLNKECKHVVERSTRLQLKLCLKIPPPTADSKIFDIVWNPLFVVDYAFAAYRKYHEENLGSTLVQIKVPGSSRVWFCSFPMAPTYVDPDGKMDCNASWRRMFVCHNAGDSKLEADTAIDDRMFGVRLMGRPAKGWTAGEICDAVQYEMKKMKLDDAAGIATKSWWSSDFAIFTSSEEDMDESGVEESDGGDAEEDESAVDDSDVDDDSGVGGSEQGSSEVDGARVEDSEADDSE